MSNRGCESGRAAAAAAAAPAAKGIESRKGGVETMKTNRLERYRGWRGGVPTLAQLHSGECTAARASCVLSNLFNSPGALRGRGHVASGERRRGALAGR